ncbi:hypothetical protein Dsin_015169 [Dipteronia sinensis]|uniref:RNase H type-1 domain-containing protein n=1 Tax=Dipteronia sinensis TaxID=43782 RepID=A0AAE0ABJ3_9ROSI|nr:hypothetical protein Dsin_015169 [Dipteronia sinensis]
MNVDAAVDSGNWNVGLGIIIRDSKGEVLACKAVHLLAGFSPVISEAWAVLHGLRFALETGLVPCYVETDSQVVVNLLRGGIEPFAEIGLVLKANTVAHCLAKLALLLVEDRAWLEEFSPKIVLAVLSDRPLQLILDWFSLVCLLSILLFSSVSSEHIAFVSRKANTVAHCLAKMALLLVEDRAWLEEFSPKIVLAVLSDRPLQL